MSAPISASYGGPGWRTRNRSHREDIEAGGVWRPCGLCSEVAPLREVVLAWPEPAWFPGGDPNAFLFLEWPDIDRLRTQAAAIGSYYESKGISVQWARCSAAPPNYLFQRDLFFMTPEGAVLARPASEQRQLEARLAAATLSNLGIPILATPRGQSAFEGADALWLDERVVLVGVGQRTNAEGARWVSALLRELGVDTIHIPLPAGVQHLLGIVNFSAHKLGTVRRGKAPDRLVTELKNAGVATVACNLDPPNGEPFGANFVTIRPGEVVMAAQRPNTRRALESAGISVEELDISEYLAAAGGLACLTGILRRAE